MRFSRLSPICPSLLKFCKMQEMSTSKHLGNSASESAVIAAHPERTQEDVARDAVRTESSSLPWHGVCTGGPLWALTHREAPQPEMLLSNNRAWAAAVKEVDPEYFDRSAYTHHPRYFWIGCSDARVPANQVVGLVPGEAFVHRNIGNIVSRGSDPSLLACLQFAIQHLRIRDILLVGHHRCGGCTAAFHAAERQEAEERLFCDPTGEYRRELERAKKEAVKELVWEKIAKTAHQSEREHAVAPATPLGALVDSWLVHVVEIKKQYSWLLNQIKDQQARINAFCEINTVVQTRHLAESTIVQSWWHLYRKQQAAEMAETEIGKEVEERFRDIINKYEDANLDLFSSESFSDGNEGQQVRSAPEDEARSHREEHAGKKESESDDVSKYYQLNINGWVYCIENGLMQPLIKFDCYTNIEQETQRGIDIIKKKYIKS